MSARVHERARVGQRFGARTVAALVHADYTANERVVWRCDCGREGIGYVFNLRKTTRCSRCGTGDRRCGCGHHENDHRPNAGECLLDDCACECFRRAS